MKARPFVIIDCLYSFACNPCQFACPHGAITKASPDTVPAIDYEKCTGCLSCVYQCPGLAIFGYNTVKNQLFLPVEYFVEEGSEVWLVDNNGKKIGEGVIEKVMMKPNRTNVARVRAITPEGNDIVSARIHRQGELSGTFDLHPCCHHGGKGVCLPLRGCKAGRDNGSHWRQEIHII